MIHPGPARIRQFHRVFRNRLAELDRVKFEEWIESCDPHNNLLYLAIFQPFLNGLNEKIELGCYAQVCAEWYAKHAYNNKRAAGDVGPKLTAVLIGLVKDRVALNNNVGVIQRTREVTKTPEVRVMEEKELDKGKPVIGALKRGVKPILKGK